MDVWLITLIALACVLWYGIGVWGTVRGLRRENAQNGTKINMSWKTFGAIAALAGPVNLLIVLVAYPTRHPRGY